MNRKANEGKLQKLLDGLTPADVRILFLAIFLCAALEFIAILLVNLCGVPKGWQVAPVVIAVLWTVAIMRGHNDR